MVSTNSLCATVSWKTPRGGTGALVTGTHDPRAQGISCVTSTKVNRPYCSAIFNEKTGWVICVTRLLWEK